MYDISFQYCKYFLSINKDITKIHTDRCTENSLLRHILNNVCLDPRKKSTKSKHILQGHPAYYRHIFGQISTT